MLLEEYLSRYSRLHDLRPATLAAIDQTADQPRTIVWPLWCCEEMFY